MSSENKSTQKIAIFAGIVAALVAFAIAYGGMQ